MMLLFLNCGNQKPPQQSTAGTGDWKLGIALWTFHTVNFPQSLSMVDSCNVRFIEPNTFHKTGADLKDSLLGDLSPAGIERVIQMAREKNLTIGSIYLAGGKNIAVWKKGFDIAKQMNVGYVTAEPPVDMWDSIDSLAGAYHLKVAIHVSYAAISMPATADRVFDRCRGMLIPIACWKGFLIDKPMQFPIGWLNQLRRIKMWSGCRAEDL